MSRIVLVGAFDTKAEPFEILVDALATLGASTTTIDTGVFGGKRRCDYPAEDVAEAGGYSLEDLPPMGRAPAVSAMTRGASRILRQLVADGRVGALVCMGGSNAAAVFSHLAPVIPIGIPKVLMATSVAGETRALVQGSDVTMLYPILDIEGNNSILRGMITRLAHVAAALVKAGRLQQAGNPENSVALTMYGVTNTCVTHCRSLLDQQGFESLVFHANGTGGRSFESFITQSLVSAAIDLTISEVTDELFGGLWPAGADRMTAASVSGTPQAVAPGATDMICLGPLVDLPESFSNRTVQVHNDLVTLVRTTPEENHRLGRIVAGRLGSPAAPTSVLVPMKGVSELDIEGGVFHDPESVEAFAQGVQSGLSPDSTVSLARLDHHINDREFAEALVEAALLPSDR
ncbi:MAG: Tm-1-like ATP-binding domain-containing protein [bacterium]|nr:Tm-1-like ATP-binding domain-containing protein [bacterium]MDE0287788.1 Tm-1-like ATP-binding domain-containing protein [bacterium]MDE0439055.1 Tm-1-like ATP-binding domain-containing protein [bacterium]